MQLTWVMRGWASEQYRTLKNLCFYMFRCLDSWTWRSSEKLLATFALPTWSTWQQRPRLLTVHTLNVYYTEKDTTWISLSKQVKAAVTFSGTKRVWMPDDTEAYTEVEVKELNGDKTTVETKDGRVGFAT